MNASPDDLDWDMRRFALGVTFAGYGPAEAMATALIKVGPQARAIRSIMRDWFTDPDIYKVIRARHAAGQRMSALAASYLDDYEFEQGLPWSIPEWHEDDDSRPRRRRG